ncbi:MAG TPA: DoxX family protein [Terriglobales bacterium]|nr:DoxX family protein [Terriglobales bacterium]
MILLGVLGFIKGDFTVLWAPVPKTVPAREALAYLCAFVSAVSGIGLLWRGTATIASRALLGYLLLWLLLFRIPGLFHSLAVDVYWSACSTAVVVSAAWVLYVWFAAAWDKAHLAFVTGRNGLHIARALYGLAIIPFGISHLQYVKQTAALVPAWLPAHLALAYFTGAAFIAAGLAILIGVCARLAAALSTLQMGLFLLLVWVPRVIARSLSAFQWGETVISLVLTAAAWVVTDSYHK